MKRRVFLSALAASVTTLLSRPALSQHANHDMSQMKAVDQADSPLPKTAHTSTLLPESALPKHAALPKLTPLVNQSKKTNEFVATLHARPITVTLADGVETQFWAYNDQIPGPAIEVFEGDTVTITFKNDLPQASTLHWHGLLVPVEQDGNPQDAVPAGKSRTYTFVIPKDSAGTYWYHPHGHETVAEQAFRGLAGTFVVKSKQDPLAHLSAQDWLISDLKLAENGQIADNSMIDWMNGREGQFVLINGAYQPHITLDQATRTRVWNACSGRYLDLALEHADLYVVGSDGGLIEKAHQVDHILLSPGERVELLIVPNKTGKSSLQALAYDRGKMGGVEVEPTRTLASVSLTASPLPKLPAILRALPDLGKATTVKQLEYTEIMDMSNGQHTMDFMINGKKHDMQRIDLKSKLGEVEEWVIFNNSHMDHNFHLHGTQFMVLEFERGGQKRSPEFRALKDTVNLQPNEKVRIKVVQHHKGIRMYHCHILEHETLGMMGQLEVI